MEETKINQQINDVAKDNLKKLEQLFPSVIKDGKVDFYVLRETKDNPKVDRQRKITILWRPELANLLR